MSAIRGFIFGVVATLAAMNIFQQGTPVQTLLPDSGAVLDVVSLHTNTNAAPPPEEHTTSIILVSNLVAVHPDINMTVGVLDSLAFYTCIYISIDGLADWRSWNLIKTFADEFYPKDIWKVEFTHTHAPKDDLYAKGPCLNMSTPVSHVNEIYLTKHTGWSDSNHLTTKEYYSDVLKQIGPQKRSPEKPMNRQAARNCKFLGTHKYGKVDEMPP